MSIAQILLPEFDHEMASTRRILAVVPEVGDARAALVAILRGFVLSHMIHHRGQLTVYLRLRDVPLPPIYGPTADSTP